MSEIVTVTAVKPAFFEADGHLVRIIGSETTYSDGRSDHGFNWQLIELSNLVADDVRDETAELIADALNAHQPAIDAINAGLPKVGDTRE